MLVGGEISSIISRKSIILFLGRRGSSFFFHWYDTMRECLGGEPNTKIHWRNTILFRWTLLKFLTILVEGSMIKCSLETFGSLRWRMILISYNNTSHFNLCSWRFWFYLVSFKHVHSLLGDPCLAFKDYDGIL